MAQACLSSGVALTKSSPSASSLPPTHAFVLGAGLGTRLRPLTDALPKPLIPLWGRPLITYAFEHLRAEAGVNHVVVNTHWCPETYAMAFPSGSWAGLPITFRHEPILLETAGGLANIADLLPPDRSFWVYNGDIFSTLPLVPAWQRHLASDDLVTLILRPVTTGGVAAFDATTGHVRDLRNLLGTDSPCTHQFTGIYLCRPEFLKWITPGKIASTRETFLDIIRANGRIGGVSITDGEWLDLGDRASYLAAHRLLAPANRLTSPQWRGVCAVGEGAEVAPDAKLEDCVVWPGGHVAPGAQLTRCIVRTGSVASGRAVDRDF